MSRTTFPSAKAIAKLKKQQLADLYIDLIGYDPFTDDKAMTVKAVRTTLVEYITERLAESTDAVKAHFIVIGWVHTDNGDDKQFMRAFYQRGTSTETEAEYMEGLRKKIENDLKKMGSAVTSDFTIKKVSKAAYLRIATY